VLHPRLVISACAAVLILSSTAFAGDPAATSNELVVQDAVTGNIYCRSQRVLVPYESADSGPSGVSAVRLYSTSDGGNTWTLYAQKPEPSGSFEFIAPSDGVYGFTVEAVDKAGNVERKNGPVGGTKPEISVVIDTHAPEIQAVFPRDGMELVPGAHLRVRFRALDPNLLPSTAAIAVRKDDMQTWVDLPNVTSDDGELFAQGEVLFAGKYTIRLSIADRAGNSAESIFNFACTPNARPPAAVPGPLGRDWEVPISAPPRATSLEFDIDYKVEDIGGLPPSKVGLWYTTDSGATWQFYGYDPDVTSPFRFQAPSEGIYGFKLTSITRSGITEPAPKPGTKPDIQTLVDVTFPTLMLDDPRGGGSYRGGDTLYIRWTARDDHFGSLPITIFVARDGGPWELLASDLPNSGVYGWNVPNLDFAQYRLKIGARDQVGNTTWVPSDVFTIVTAPPETRITAVTAAVPLLGAAQVSTGATPQIEPQPEPQPRPAPEPPRAADQSEVKKLIETATGLRLRGDYEGAQAALREAIKKDPAGTYAKCELGALLIQEGRHAEAVEILREARSADAKDAEVLYNLATAYYALANYRDAAMAFESFVALDPKNEAALWNLGKAYKSDNNILRARETWRKIVAMDAPGSPFVRKAREALEAVPEPKNK